MNNSPPPLRCTDGCKFVKGVCRYCGDEIEYEETDYDDSVIYRTLRRREP